MGQMVAASRRIPTTDLAGQDLEAQLNASDQSSAAPARRNVDLGSRVACVSSLARKRKCTSRREILRNVGSSILEISLHADGQSINRTNGAHRRSENRRYPCECYFSFLVRRRH